MHSTASVKGAMLIHWVFNNSNKIQCSRML